MSFYKGNHNGSPPSIRKEEEPINVDYGDSDDDSDVIVIDTTPTMLAEKISADCDAVQDSQQRPKAAKRLRTEGAETSVPSALNNNSCDRESKPSYKRVFEGCNSSEPIEIDDDSEDESSDCNFKFENGKSNNEITEKSETHLPKNSDRKVPSQPATNSANTKRKTCDSDLGKREEKENQRKQEEIKRVGNGDLVSSKTHTTDRKACSPRKDNSSSSTDSVIDTDTGASNKNFHNADSSVGDDEDDGEDDDKVEIEDYDEDSYDDDNEDDYDDDNEDCGEDDNEDYSEEDDDDGEEDGTVPQPTEVINLADDDDDSITSEKEPSPPIDEKGHGDVQQPTGTCETTKAAIEIIDVDEMDDIEFEVKDGKELMGNGGMGTKREGTNNKIHSKPRFKPNKNNSARIREKEWNTVRTFRTILRRQKEEEGRRKATPNYGVHNDITPPNSACSARNFSSSTENRFIFHSSNGRPEDHHTNTFLGMNLEDAHKEQERLLNQAAQRVRNQPAFHVTNNDPIRSKTVTREITFSAVVRDVHLQYPGHFKYRDFYSRLGLPRDANEDMVKSQYRRLARVYHPDRNIGKSDTKHKFQAVTEAYNHLMNI